MASNKNPNNENSFLYKALTKVFSGPLATYKRQAVTNQRTKYISKYADRIKSASGQEFKKSEYDIFSHLQTSAFTAHSRIQRYKDFHEMEFDPDLSSVLDLYADEMTTHSDLHPLLNVRCPNEEIRDILTVLYKKILNIDFNLYGWCRTMCKYGDFFLFLDIEDGVGIRSVLPLPVDEIERLEGEDRTNPNYIRFQWNMASVTFENWQVAHFRVLGNDKYAPLGTSVLDPARRVWRQKNLLEDAMMAYRIVRSPERKVFYIDVGNIPPEDVEKYMNQVIGQMKKNQIVDPNSGMVDLRYNPLSVEEDMYIPVRGNTGGTRIESLPGGSYTGDIDDVKYLRDKLYSAIKVPMSYLSRGEGADEDKQSLAQKDIRFARTIQRLQRSVVSEMEKIGIIHLYTMGYRGQDLLSFKVSLNNPSKIAEMQELEQWKTRFEVASAATDGYFSKQWIAKKMFGLSDEEFLRTQREMFYDKKYEDVLDSTQGFDEETEEDTQVTGGNLVITPQQDEVAEQKENDDGGVVTPGAKGKIYYPVKYDKRDSGARKRSMMSQYSSELGKNTDRNIFPGSLVEKANDISTYLGEEKLEQLNNDIKLLLKQLDGLEKGKNNRGKLS